MRSSVIVRVLGMTAIVLMLVPPLRAADGLIPPRDQMRMPWEGSPAPAALRPTLAASDGNTLRVQLDRAMPGEGPAIRCQVVAPGGRVMAEEQGRRGQTLAFQCGNWDDGPYELRFETLPSEAPMLTYVPWYKGDMPAAVRQMKTRLLLDGEGQMSGILKAGLEPGEAAHLQMLADLLAHRLGGKLENIREIPPKVFSSVHSALMEIAEILPGAMGGKGPAIRPNGFARFAFQDPVDDSWQFCRVYLPRQYDPAEKWPLVVILHGYYPANPPYIGWWDVDKRHHAIADKYNAIVIEPHARGNGWYRGIGEKDVLRCIELAKARLSVDADRVLLAGYSMGGGGTWNIGTRHPSLFAAIAPIFGGWDYRATITPEDFAALTPDDHRRFERESSFAQAEMLLNTPLFLNHGDNDELVNVEQTRYAVRMMQRWGYDLRYWEHPGKGHGGLNSEDAMMRWFLPLKRISDPRRVRIRATELKSAEAQWVKIEQRENPLELILADAQIIGPNLVKLDTQNVLAATLSPGRGVDAAMPLKVIWNSAKPVDVKMADGKALLAASDPGQTPALRKTPQREGPISEVQATPFAIIIGTIADNPEMHFAVQHRANTMAEAWEKWQKVKPRLFTDNVVTEAELSKYSLILVGGPDENLVARRFADRIPLRLSPDAITIDGRAFPARNSAVQMVYPHPLAKDLYVQVIAANSPSAMFYADDLPEDVDFAISDGRLSSRLSELSSLRNADRPDPLALVAYGCFDRNWRLDERFIVRGDDALRRQSPVRKSPRYTWVPQDVPTLQLSDLLEADAQGNFTKMKRDLNYRGKPIILAGRTYASGLAAQILRDAPSLVDFNIAPAGFKRLRGTIGIETRPQLTDLEKQRTRIVFIVKGDGREIYRSGPFAWDSPPRELDVDVTGVKSLRLDLSGEGRFNGAASCDWAEIRLEK